MEEQERVIPLEIKGSITVYPQSYVDKLNKKLEKAKKLIKGMNEYLSTQPEFWSRKEKLEIVELSEKAEQFLKEIKE